VFLPYLIGGIVPGVIVGLAAYYISLPVITAYQKRRKGVVAAKWQALKEKRAKEKLEGEADERGKAD
jgi:uncharacterized protein (DUF2062 family)